MKKICTLFLFVSFLVFLSACNKDESSPTKDPVSSFTSETIQAPQGLKFSTKDEERVFHLRKLSLAIATENFMNSVPVVEKNGCVNTALFDDYAAKNIFEKIDKDPNGEKILDYGNGITCNGEYYYVYKPNAKYLYGILSLTDDETKANSSCVEAMKGNYKKTTAPFCYSILYEPLERIE